MYPSGLKTDCDTAVIAVIAADHAFIQNLRRGHYEPGMAATSKHRLADAFHELGQVI